MTSHNPRTVAAGIVNRINSLLSEPGELNQEQYVEIQAAVRLVNHVLPNFRPVIVDGIILSNFKRWVRMRQLRMFNEANLLVNKVRTVLRLFALIPDYDPEYISQALEHLETIGIEFDLREPAWEHMPDFLDALHGREISLFGMKARRSKRSVRRRGKSIRKRKRKSPRKRSRN